VEISDSREPACDTVVAEVGDSRVDAQHVGAQVRVDRGAVRADLPVIRFES
jgi:hypothetical protein